MSEWEGEEGGGGKFKFKSLTAGEQGGEGDVVVSEAEALGSAGLLSCSQVGFFNRKDRLNTPTCLQFRVPTPFAMATLLVGPNCIICEVGGAQILVDLGGGGFQGGLVVGWELICEVGGALILVGLGGGDV